MTKDYAAAISPLSQVLSSKGLDRSQEKSALVALISCAHERGDLVLFSKALLTLKSQFAHDEETAKILLMHAQLCREKKEWAKARATVAELLEVSPDHPQKEALLFDQALLLAQEEKWQESAAAFDAFLKQFPQSGHRANALRQLIHCHLEDLRQSSPTSAKIKKERLLTILKASLEEKKIFSGAEKQKMHYLTGKLQFELGCLEDAIGTLSEYVRDFSKDPTCADAHLLLALAHQGEERDAVHFILHAEKALALNAQIQGAVDLHLALFNAYLERCEASPHEKKDLMSKAADHLF